MHERTNKPEVQGKAGATKVQGSKDCLYRVDDRHALRILKPGRREVVAEATSSRGAERLVKLLNMGLEAERTLKEVKSITKIEPTAGSMWDALGYGGKA